MAGLIRASGVVVYYLEDDEPQFLLIRSRRDRSWGFPKGHLIDGEDILQGAMRELWEETGIREVSLVHGFTEHITYRVNRAGRFRRKTVTYFLGRVDTPVVRLSEEHSEHRWAVVEDARKLLSFDNLRALVTRAWMTVAPLSPQFFPEEPSTPQL
ncbi:MAG TPA: NUDIX domain-containing protein [Alphaproteobacteria bacterium]|jgi:8-oxo-dGTP pyrophosphatase MutT (NUDIX family)|nr:NUDIX domain-containing protein [Alphaproteobacteria bacterium]